MPNAQPEDFSKTAHHEPIPPALNQIRAVRLFMQAGGQHTDVMDAKQTGFYIGMELEELAEQLREVAAGKVTPLNPHDDIVQTINWMEMLAKQFKENAFYGDLMRADRRSCWTASSTRSSSPRAPRCRTAMTPRPRSAR